MPVLLSIPKSKKREKTYLISKSRFSNIQQYSNCFIITKKNIDSLNLIQVEFYLVIYDKTSKHIKLVGMKSEQNTWF